MTNDRLKFRAFYKDFPLYDDEKGDYTKSFMIYNVSPYSDGGVGTYVEDFEDQLEQQGFTEDEIEQIRDFFSYSEYDDWVAFWGDDVEQCTGLKDKNGTPIYEGDIIKKPYNDFYEYSIHVISWEDGVYTTKRCLAMKDKKSGELTDCSNGGFCFSSHITQDLANSFEVIGNIHKNPELLK